MKNLLAPSPSAPAPHRHWLVVDDEAELGAVTAEILTGLGVARVERCQSPAAALAAFAARPARFQLVVTDLDMPGFDGLELARRLHRSAPGLPIVLLSANADCVPPYELRRAGICASLAKPFSIAALEAAVHQAQAA